MLGVAYDSETVESEFADVAHLEWEFVFADVLDYVKDLVFADVLDCVKDFEFVVVYVYNNHFQKINWNINADVPSPRLLN